MDGSEIEIGSNGANAKLVKVVFDVFDVDGDGDVDVDVDTGSGCGCGCGCCW